MSGHERVVILDFGSQYNQLIARRIREAGVFSEVHPCSLDLAAIKALQPKAIVLSGGPASVYEARAPQFDPGILELGVPILGICYGMQLLMRRLGGGVQQTEKREYGRAEIKLDRKHKKNHPLLKDLPSNPWRVWMSHGDQVEILPEGFVGLGSSATCPNALVADDRRKIYGLQFHPEVTHTEDGERLISNFLYEIAGLKGDWTGQSFIEEEIKRIQTQYPEGNIILGLSGGVDSSVAAALLHKAVGDRLHCIFVDNGLLRKNEAREVVETFAEHFKMRLIHVDAADEFMNSLVGVDDPERKRKIIGKAFVDVFERESEKIPNALYLAQGTIYPDVIESVSAKGGPSAKIKSHHNVGGLPERMKLKIVEPLRELFKDEVRQIGGLLGLPRALLQRHPFPGPGLGVRILGAVDKEKADILREADAIFIEELISNHLYNEIAQAFAVFLPVRSVGVMGDGRTYENVIALRAVKTSDFMTADHYPIDHDLLAHIATRIVNEVRGVNRVAYDVTSKPPATIEWE